MKKVKIGHLPEWMKWAEGIGILLWLFVTLAASMLAKDQAEGMAVTAVSMLVFIALLVILAALSKVKTTVEFGDGSVIKCTWLRFEYQLDIKKTKSVLYTITTHRSRYGTTLTLDLVFCFEDDSRRLTEIIKAEDVAKCIAGRADSLPLMQLYRFVESAYPEKAFGFRKEEIW